MFGSQCHASRPASERERDRVSAGAVEVRDQEQLALALAVVDAGERAARGLEREPRSQADVVEELREPALELSQTLAADGAARDRRHRRVPHVGRRERALDRGPNLGVARVVLRVPFACGKRRGIAAERVGPCGSPARLRLGVGVAWRALRQGVEEHHLSAACCERGQLLCVLGRQRCDAAKHQQLVTRRTRDQHAVLRARTVEHARADHVQRVTEPFAGLP